MGLTVRFTVPGEPRGKGRPRATIRGGHAGVYTDAKTASFENLVALAAKTAMAGREPIDGPVHLTVRISMQPPASASKKRLAAMLSGELRPTKVPDTVNVLAAVQDGMNQIVYQDDKQVVAIAALKRYAATPGLEVTITEILP